MILTDLVLVLVFTSLPASRPAGSGGKMDHFRLEKRTTLLGKMDGKIDHFRPEKWITFPGKWMVNGPF